MHIFSLSAEVCLSHLYLFGPHLISTFSGFMYNVIDIHVTIILLINKGCPPTVWLFCHSSLGEGIVIIEWEDCDDKILSVFLELGSNRNKSNNFWRGQV